MPASRIFCLARTRRCAIASSLARKARATCAVESPHTVRKVSATCTSGAKDGWQQVKIRRSMSSLSTATSAISSDVDAFSSSSCVSSPSLPRNAIWRRMRSIALLRPTLTSHALGFEGTSCAGQRSSAAAKASCNTSSARSKSPTRRISVASARPASSRKILSISVGVMPFTALTPCHSGASRSDEPGIHNHRLGLWIPGLRLAAHPGMTTERISVVHPDRPHLDRAIAVARAGNPRRNAERGVEILGLYQIIAAELLARFGKRAIRGHDLAVLDAHGGRSRGWPQTVASLEVAALDDVLGKGFELVRHLLGRCRIELGVLGFVRIDHQQILHVSLLFHRLDRRHPVERTTAGTTSQDKIF